MDFLPAPERAQETTPPQEADDLGKENQRSYYPINAGIL
jgi:hypothetical protein